MKLLGASSTESQARDSVDEWARTFDAGDTFASTLYQTSFQAALAGQLFVRSIELADEAGAAPGTIKLSATRDAGGSFLAMPFDDAVAFFRAKAILTPAEFDALRDRFRAGGFIARGLASTRLQEVARDAIDRLLSQGLTLPEVTAAIRSGEASLGIEPTSSAYLDTVIRTNVATAYGAGRYAAMTDPNVVALRPWVQQRTAGDARVRPGHAALNGLVFANGGDLAARYAPPLFFRCRCGQVTLSQRQYEARGLSETTTRVEAMEAEEFWTGVPGPLTAADS